MKYFVKALGVAFHCNDLVDVANSMPLSLQTVHKMFGIANSDFEIYVVCPSCQSVYHFEDCLIRKSMGCLVKRQGFLETCELWRKRSTLVPSGHLGDGKVWNDFNSLGPN